MPLADATLRMATRIFPSPIDAQRSKLRKIVFDPSGRLTRRSSEAWGDYSVDTQTKDKILSVLSGISACSNADDSDVVIFVSKMVPVRVSELRADDLSRLNSELKRRDPSANNLDNLSGEVLMALGRIFSGTVTRLKSLYALSHRHDPSVRIDLSEDYTSNTLISPNSYGLYLVLGPSVVPVDSVPAGNIVGIVGISDYILKTGTLASSLMSPALKAMTFQAKPMVRVAVEPVNFYDLNRIERGLKMLYQYDPAVEIKIDSATGQHTMTCLGEIHQEQCVKYLVEKFAKCEVSVSEPIVPFRETIKTAAPSFKPILPFPWSDAFNFGLNSGNGTYAYESSTLSLQFRCLPLSDELLKEFDDNPAIKTELFSYSSRKHLDSSCTIKSAVSSTFTPLLCKLLGDGGALSEGEALRRLVSVGPVDADAVNLCMLSSDFTVRLWASKPVIITEEDSPDAVADIRCPQHVQFVEQMWSWIHAAVGSGFQLCCAAGPLMSELIHGVAFMVNRMDVSMESLSVECDEFFTIVDALNQKSEISSRVKMNVQSGQLISDIRYHKNLLLCIILTFLQRCAKNDITL